jgi:hypothetical protein
MPMSPRLLRPILSGDPDARRYIAAVQAADQQSLELAVRKAITDFVVGCKADGIWSAIKASCILMGARTLSGALTPLVGTAPTNNGPFVSGDYDRKTGLVGNGTSKYLDTGRAGNADPQNDIHAAVYVSSWSTAQSGYRAFIGSGDTVTGASNLFWQSSPANSGVRSRSSTANTTVSAPANAINGNLQAGLFGTSRSASGSYTLRANATSLSVTQASQVPPAFNWWVFTANNNGATVSPTPSRLAYYSVGESINLASLGTRLATLYDAIGNAIP